MDTVPAFGTSPGRDCNRGDTTLRVPRLSGVGIRASRLVTGTFFFVFVRLLREGRTPDLFLRLQALGPDLPLHGALVRNDPSDPELCLLVAVANFDLVADLHLAPATPEFYTVVADI